MEIKLNERQKQFCELYVLGGENGDEQNNVTGAYVVAYPNSNRFTAGKSGHNLLKRPEVQKYITQLRQEKRLRQIKTIQSLQDEILELAKLELSTAKMMIESVNVTYTKARKIEENGDVAYDISDRKQVSTAQVIRAYLELRKTALDSVSALNGLPDIEQFILKHNEHLL